MIRDRVDKDYDDTGKAVLVMENLNTHEPASRFESFEPAEARDGVG